ncbi:MAG: 7TM diverse intracellular signaling domain-containing protein [Reyranellaceae bacterium]
MTDTHTAIPGRRSLSTARHGAPAPWLALLFAVLSSMSTAAHGRSLPPSFLVDAERRLTVRDVLAPAAADRFRALPPVGLDEGFSPAAFWLRLSLPPAGGEALIARAGSPTIDRIEWYLVRDGTPRALGVSGDSVAFGKRAYAHRLPAVRIDAAATDGFLLARVTTAGAVRVPVAISRERAFLRHAAAEDLFYGLYWGVLLAMIAYNAFVFAAVREASYGWYVAYLAAITLLQAKLTGYADQYLWPSLPALANPVNLLAFGAALVLGARFTRAFLSGAPARPSLMRAVSIAQAPVVALCVAYIFLPYTVAMRLMMVLAAVMIVVLTATIIDAWRRGARSARFIMLAFAALAIGSVVYMLRAMGVIEPSWVADHALDLGTAFEAILLSFALGDRIGTLDAARRLAEAELSAARRSFAAELLGTQERERGRMAAELHDAIGQNLVVMGNRVKALRRDGNVGPGALDQLGEVNHDTLERVRALAASMRPVEIDRLGLGGALATMLERAVSGTAIEARSEIGPVDDLVRDEDRIHVYRIAQEAVTNALKHAGASRLSLSLRADGERLRLEVADDGGGFDVRPANEGFGSASMRERAALVDGDIEISSRPGAGTRVTLLVPAGDG